MVYQAEQSKLSGEESASLAGMCGMIVHDVGMGWIYRSARVYNTQSDDYTDLVQRILPLLRTFP
jgi:hypothetical protein